jgi:hypothetical protein
VFDSLTPPREVNTNVVPRSGQEEFAWDCENHKWLSLYELQMGIAYMRVSDDMGAIVYVGQKKHIYRWKGVALSTDTGVFHRNGGLNAIGDMPDYAGREDLFIEVDPPVQFYKDPEGKFRPCYFDPNGKLFVWKNVIVPESQVPKESVQHRWPVLELGKPGALRFKVYEIDIPEHMVSLVKEWIVKPSETKPGPRSPVNENAKPPQSVFESLTPPKGDRNFQTSTGREEFAWHPGKNDWISIDNRSYDVIYLRIADGIGTIAYQGPVKKEMTFYRWKGVEVPAETKLFERDDIGGMGIDLRKERGNVTIEDVDPPIQFYKDPD